MQPHRRQSTRLLCPWDSPGKNTGVGCHFLLQSKKVKSESEITQSCPTRSNSMDCSLPGSSIHGIFQERVLEWGAIAFSIELPYNPAIPLVGIHTKEIRTERHTCTPMFIAALFTIARTWKQPRCPLADEWIRNLWYIYTHNGILLSYWKEHIWISSNEVDKTGSYYTEWSKSERKIPIQYIKAYIWNLERW